MAKGGREKIKLESTAGTGHFYTTSKNKKPDCRDAGQDRRGNFAGARCEQVKLQ